MDVVNEYWKAVKNWLREHPEPTTSHTKLDVFDFLVYNLYEA